MIVVSDTTPLNYLVLINAIDVLPKLFAEIYIPPTVIAELSHLQTPAPVKIWAQSPPSWLKIVAPKMRLTFASRLDAGEADALSLAKELQITHVLMDERQGRNVAKREGLTAIPTLAILERAAELNLLDFPSAVTALRNTTIRIPQNLVNDALARDAARKLAAQIKPPLA